jgi:GNAT superfamily N-acetyltransferase
MIRTAREDELDEVVAMYDWLFAPPGSPPPAWDVERARAVLSQLVAAPDAEVFVADGAGRLAGLCTVALDIVSVRYGRRAWVEDLVVAPDARSGGLGRQLLDAAKAWARDRGATHLELDSGEARTDAHRFYERERPAWRSISYGWLL